MIVIGTPVHESKAYAMTEWLDSVNALIMPDGIEKQLIIVDNSPTTEFITQIDDYVKEKKYQFIETSRLPLLGSAKSEARMGKSREEFSKKIKEKSGIGWLLSWECDIIVEPDALLKLWNYKDDFDLITSTYPSREDVTIVCGGIGFMLINMKVLNQFDWMGDGGYGLCDVTRPNCTHSNDSWMVHRALRAGYKLIEVTNYLKIQHLGS